MVEEYDVNTRTIPASDLDFNMEMVEPEWGREKGKALSELGTVRFNNYRDDGSHFVDRTNKNELLKQFTKDLRLANLDDQELRAVRYDLDLANDVAIEGFSRTWLSLRARNASITETSQSKQGFLRRLMNTITHENKNQLIEPPKKSFFGKGQNNNGGY